MKSIISTLFLSLLFYGCFGCQFYESFKLNTDALSNSETEADSFYIVVGGNFIREPVIY